LLSVYTFTCYALSVAPVTYYNCFIVIVTVIYSFIVVNYFFLLISMHFIHLFSILLPVCFNKFSVQCVQWLWMSLSQQCYALTCYTVILRGWRGATTYSFMSLLARKRSTQPATQTFTGKFDRFIE